MFDLPDRAKFTDKNGNKWIPCNLNKYNLQGLPLLHLVETPSQPGEYQCHLKFDTDVNGRITTLLVKPIAQASEYPHITYKFHTDENTILSWYHYSEKKRQRGLTIGKAEYNDFKDNFIPFCTIIVREYLKQNSWNSLLEVFGSLFRKK